MARQSVTSVTEFPAKGAGGISPDELAEARDLIAEAVAVQELISRVQHDNEEDFEMLQKVSAVTFRILQEAGCLLSGEK